MGTLTNACFGILVAACIVLLSSQYVEEPEVVSILKDYTQQLLPEPVARQLTHVIQSLNTILRSVLSYVGVGEKNGSTASTNNNNLNDKNEKVFTKEELAGFKFKYLAIVGEVFNVATEKGKRHYGANGHYNFFTGVDGTKAFVSGDFTEKGLIDSIDGLSAADIRALEDWRLMYHKDYIYMGKVVGAFYDSEGKETKQMVKFRQLLNEAEQKKSAEERMNKMYPPCNSEFKNQASRVWCTTLSGGIQRSWVGVPRKLFTPATGHSRCVCVRTTGPPSTDYASTTHNNRGDLDNPNLREYPNCSPTAESCPI